VRRIELVPLVSAGAYLVYHVPINPTAQLSAYPTKGEIHLRIVGKKQDFC